MFPGGTPSTAGYLTQGPSTTVSMAPPPVDEEYPSTKCDEYVS